MAKGGKELVSECLSCKAPKSAPGRDTYCWDCTKAAMERLLKEMRVEGAIGDIYD